MNKKKQTNCGGGEDEYPPDTQGQKEPQVVIDKASRCNSGSGINSPGFLRGVSLRQRTNVHFCGFDVVANHILHDWGTNNVVGMGADKTR